LIYLDWLGRRAHEAFRRIFGERRYM
jgi:hypothetical protein